MTVKQAPRVCAWRVSCSRLGNEYTGIYPACSRGQAKAKAVAQSNEAGYRLSFADFKATRAPEYDEWITSLSRVRPWAEDWAAEAMADWKKRRAQ